MKRRILPLLINSLVLVSLLTYSDGIAQRRAYHQNQKGLYLGIGAGYGTRSFRVSSDIESIDGLRASTEGPTMGVFGGTNSLLGRLNYGAMKSSALTREKVQLTELTFGANVFPVHLIGRTNKYFKPYAILAFNRQNVKFYGSFALPTPPPALPQSGAHQCPDAPGHPDDPVVEPESDQPTNDDEEKFRGSVIVTRFDMGVGFILHLPMRNRFINLYSEIKHGSRMGNKAMTLEFQRTHLSRQFAVEIGLAFGVRSLYY
jgi:hypothetical protein